MTDQKSDVIAKQEKERLLEMMLISRQQLVLRKCMKREKSNVSISKH